MKINTSFFWEDEETEKKNKQAIFSMSHCLIRFLLREKCKVECEDINLHKQTHIEVQHSTKTKMSKFFGKRQLYGTVNLNVKRAFVVSLWRIFFFIFV